MENSLRVVRLVFDIFIGVCVGWNIDLVIAWIKGKRRIKRTPDSKQGETGKKP